MDMTTMRTGNPLVVPEVLVCIDLDNVNISLESIGKRVDYRALLTYFFDECGGGASVSAFVFSGIRPNETAQKIANLQYLSNLGFTVTETKGTSEKANSDVALTLLAAEHLLAYNKPAAFVLFSGDRDYIPLLELARKHKVEAVIFAARRSLSRDLEKSVATVYHLDDQPFVRPLHSEGAA